MMVIDVTTAHGKYNKFDTNAKHLQFLAANNF